MLSVLDAALVFNSVSSLLNSTEQRHEWWVAEARLLVR